MKTDLYNISFEKVGTVDLPDRIFGRNWSPELVHQALVTQVANSRTRVAYARDRSKVSGGGKKPWRQKGTGRARHGSIRSPIWKGGGVTHGPTKEKDYSKQINKKMAQAALFSALSERLRRGEIKVVESLEIKEPKTKVLADILKNIESAKKSVLFIPSVSNKNIYLAARNLPKTKSLSPESLNIYDILKYKNIILDKESITVIDKKYAAIK